MFTGSSGRAHTLTGLFGLEVIGVPQKMQNVRRLAIQLSPLLLDMDGL